MAITALRDRGLFVPCEDVCKGYHVTVRDVLSGSTTQSIARARHACLYMLREQTELSYAELGKMMLLNSTSVIHGIRNHRSRMNAKGAA